MDVFCLDCGDVFAGIHLFTKHQIVHFKYVSSTVGQLYVNNIVKKSENLRSKYKTNINRDKSSNQGVRRWERRGIDIHISEAEL